MPWRIPWNRKYVIKSYLRGSLWLMPFFAVVAVMVFVRVTEVVDRWLMLRGLIDETTAFLGLTGAGARSMFDTIITMNLSFMVFTFGSLLVAIQVAGGQYTPRIIATTLLRDNAIRFSVGFFVFTLLFANRILIRMEGETVYQFNAMLAGSLGLFSMVVFLYLIDHAARFLRPGSLVQKVGKSGITVIESVYPEPFVGLPPLVDSSRGPASPGRTDAAARSLRSGRILQRLDKLRIAAIQSVVSKPTGRGRAHEASRIPAVPDRIVNHKGNSGVLIAVDLPGLIAQARRTNGMIEFVPQVGNFLSADEPLFRLYGGASAIGDRELRAAIAIGSERTIEQDPTFAFRVLVDIAIKALSAAINDPTTAVLAIDQLHRLLRRVGLQSLLGEELCDEAGEVRLIFRTPNWEDFVHLACTEIRHCGRGSVQVMRRMHSMLEDLTKTLPPDRHAELREQLALMDQAIDEHYTFAENRALARIPDPQGLGGAFGAQPAMDAPTGDAGDRAAGQ